MNSDNNTVSARHSEDPTNADKIRVSARLLFPYVANSPLPFKEWEDSLRRMAVNLDYVLMGYRVFDDGRGGLALNLKLAMHFIIGSSIYPNGAVARVLLDEALSGAGSGDVDCVDHLLEQYWKVGIVPGLVQAKALHTFLCCGMAFEDWFLGQKKSQRMVYGQDYFRIFGTTVYKRDNGQGEIYLTHEVAERAIKATPTPRGRLASTYLRNPTLRGSGV
jgi:hypothetical protein